MAIVTRTCNSLRLPRNHAGADAATLRGNASALAENQAFLSNQSRPAKQPLARPAKERGGAGGKRVSASPRRLCAAFDARKRLSSNSINQPPKEQHRTRLLLAMRALTSSSVGGFSGRGKRLIAMPEQALAKRTNSSSAIPCKSAYTHPAL